MVVRSFLIVGGFTHGRVIVKHIKIWWDRRPFILRNEVVTVGEQYNESCVARAVGAGHRTILSKDKTAGHSGVFSEFGVKLVR